MFQGLACYSANRRTLAESRDSESKRCAQRNTHTLARARPGCLLLVRVHIYQVLYERETRSTLPRASRRTETVKEWETLPPHGRGLYCPPKRSGWFYGGAGADRGKELGTVDRGWAGMRAGKRVHKLWEKEILLGREELLFRRHFFYSALSDRTSRNDSSVNFYPAIESLGSRRGSVEKRKIPKIHVLPSEMIIQRLRKLEKQPLSNLEETKKRVNPSITEKNIVCSIKIEENQEIDKNRLDRIGFRTIRLSTQRRCFCEHF